MRQRPSPTRRSRKFSRRGSLGWYLKRMRLVQKWWEDMQAIERESRYKLMREMPPYSGDALAGIPDSQGVQFIREGGERMDWGSGDHEQGTP